MFEEYLIGKLFKLKPILVFPENIGVARINRLNTDGMTMEDLDEYYDKIVKFLSFIPFAKYKQITVSTKGNLKYPQTLSQEKNEFIRKMETFTNSMWNIRERESFLVYQLPFDERTLYGNAELLKGAIEKADKSDLKRALAKLFNGDEKQPFGQPLYKWQYGFKIGDKYAIGLINYNVGANIVKYAMDFLNYTDDDYLSILHFEMMDKLQAEMTISNAISIAEKTGMPSQVIQELHELKSENFARGVGLVKFFHIIYLFADSQEEALQKAYRLKSLAPYEYAFEGNIEFEAIFSLTDFNFLKGKDMTGIVRKSTIDYFASMIYITGRYTGKPAGRWIPMLNGIGEASYIPIDSSLFNLAVQGQMGSGKSVSIQYIATMFDSVVFIEKIQSDVGSYAVYCQYFNGDHIPLSLEVPVSINPLGKAYEYFTLDLFDMAKGLGINEPHRFFDENERQAIAFALDDYFFTQNKETLTKQDITEALKDEKRAIRLLKKLEEQESFEWKAKVRTNPVKKVFVNTVLSFIYAGEDIDIPEFSQVRSTLEKVVDGFYEVKYNEDRNQEVFLHQLFEYAKENMEQSHIKERFLSRLYSFIRDGKYGHLFDRPTSIRRDVEHIFFEVRFSEKEVIPIAILSILNFINNTFGSVKYREKSKLVVIDEGWFFMRIEMAKNFIDEAFRTYRKRGIGIAFATQNPEDFEGMTNYFPYVSILYLEDPDSVVRVYKFTERDRQLIKSIDKPKAYNYRYAKMFFKFKNEAGKDEKGLFLLPSYPEFRWIAETDPVFKLKREEYILKYGSLKNAIEKLSEEL